MNDLVPRVLSLIPQGDSEGCLIWRHWWPAQEMTKRGHLVDWRFFKLYKQTIEPDLIAGAYNLVVTPRFVWREQWMVDRFRYTLAKTNMTWAYEVDDDMFSPEIVERQVGFAVANGRPSDMTPDEHVASVRSQMEFERQERIRILGLVDGVTVSTPALAEIARAHTTAPISIVPNAMNIEWFTDHLARHERSVAPLTIGWSGGWRFFQDIAVFSVAWPIVAQRFPDVHFVLHGWAVPEIVRVLPADRLHYLPWTSIEDYPAALKNIDIACCSVADTEWNKSKSCIKWYEMSMAGSAVVASHALYGSEIQDGYDGLLATSVEEWVEQLSRLVADARLRREINRAARQTVRDHHNLALSWSRWINAWSDMLHAHHSHVPVAA